MENIIFCAVPGSRFLLVIQKGFLEINVLEASETLHETVCIRFIFNCIDGVTISTRKTTYQP